jgi:CRP/FNR family nitrogen fixation transcriptional regulator
VLIRQWQGVPALLISIDRVILAAAKLESANLSYERGNTVYERGASAQFIYAVNKGALRRVKPLGGGKQTVLQFLFPGDGFGYELGHRHRDTVQALINTEVVATRKKALLGVAASNVRFACLLFAAAAQAVVLAEEQSLLRGLPAVERIALFLLEMDARLSKRDRQINLPMNRRDISDYLGLTVETISRIMNELQRTKIVKFQGERQRQIVIRDKKRLQRLASDALGFDWWKR